MFLSVDIFHPIWKKVRTVISKLITDTYKLQTPVRIPSCQAELSTWFHSKTSESSAATDTKGFCQLISLFCILLSFIFSHYVSILLIGDFVKRLNSNLVKHFKGNMNISLYEMV